MKFNIGEQVDFKWYNELRKGVIKQVAKGGYYIEASKRDISRRMTTNLIFVRESNVAKIQVRSED